MLPDLAFGSGARPGDAPASGTPRPCRVTRVRRDAADVVTLDLEPALPLSFEPGQFNMLYLFGRGEVPISMSGDPANRRRLRHTIRAVGELTRGLCRLRRGDVVGVRGPFGTPWPLRDAEGGDVIVMAGGIGLAPLMPLVERLARRRRRFGRVAVLVGARTPADLILQARLETLARHRDLAVHVTVDAGTPEWRGSVGVVTRLLPQVAFAAERTSAYLCGPEVMMRFGARDLLASGVDPRRLHVSLERNMKCATGFCGHCMFGPDFVCRDGPVLPWSRVGARLLVPAL